MHGMVKRNTLVTRRINTKLAWSQRHALTRRLSTARWRNLANTLISCFFPPLLTQTFRKRARVDCIVGRMRRNPQVTEGEMSLPLFCLCSGVLSVFTPPAVLHLQRQDDELSHDSGRRSGVTPALRHSAPPLGTFLPGAHSSGRRGDSAGLTAMVGEGPLPRLRSRIRSLLHG